MPSNDLSSLRLTNRLHNDAERIARYADALAWIAENDEPTITEPDDMKDLVSVVLVADIFGLPPSRVAFGVCAVRALVSSF